MHAIRNAARSRPASVCTCRVLHSSRICSCLWCKETRRHSPNLCLIILSNVLAAMAPALLVLNHSLDHSDHTSASKPTFVTRANRLTDRCLTLQSSMVSAHSVTVFSIRVVARRALKLACDLRSQRSRRASMCHASSIGRLSRLSCTHRLCLPRSSLAASALASSITWLHARRAMCRCMVRLPCRCLVNR